MRFLAALLALSMPLHGAGEAQLLPAGKFSARDGRPGPGKQWEVTDAQGVKLATTLNAVAAKTPIVIDYDHQTLHSEKNGQQALAAGWIKSVEWRAGNGLFATVEWTAKAKGHIDAKEYLYISPVITYDEAGLVTGVLLAALVNYPALTGMNAAVAQLAAQLSNPDDQQELDMALLAALLAAIGLPANTTEAAALAHVTTLQARPPVPTLLSAALGLAATADEAAATAAVTALKTKPIVPVALSAALGLAATADEAAALTAITTLKAGTDSTTQLVAQLQAEVNTLKSGTVDRSLNELLDKAIADKKITPTSREQYAAIGRSNLAQLSALIGSLPSIPGLDGQSGGKGPGDTNTAALSAQGASVMASFGLSAEQFAKGATAAA